jgi:hypothetical protein
MLYIIVVCISIFQCVFLSQLYGICRKYFRCALVTQLILYITPYEFTAFPTYTALWQSPPSHITPPSREMNKPPPRARALLRIFHI